MPRLLNRSFATKHGARAERSGDVMKQEPSEIERLEWQLKYYRDRLSEQPGDGMFLQYIRDTCDQLDRARDRAVVNKGRKP